MTGITESSLKDVLAHWPVASPLALEPIATGTNNRSWLVRSGTHAYVLKWYQNDNLERLRFEHALLGALAEANLSFAVPAPVSTASGDTRIGVSRDHEVERFALFHRIPGRAAAFGSSAEAFRCGEALADLDQALDTVTLDPAVPPPGTIGDLASVHAAVPEPMAMIERLSGGDALATDLATVLSRAEERWQRDTAGWRPQLIHSDFYPSNTLIDAGEVSGILDFEFSCTGYRAMDFAIGLAAFSARNWDEGCAWPLVDAFATGYLRRAPLAAEELAATPTLLRMREASSLIHWLGRMVEGLTTQADVHDRAHRLLGLDRWLEAHGTELVHRLIRTSTDQGQSHATRHPERRAAESRDLPPRRAWRNND